MKARWQCPKCGSEDLKVSIRVWGDLTQYDDGNFETDTYGDHEWDEFSLMYCRECDYESTVLGFDTSAKERVNESKV